MPSAYFSRLRVAYRRGTHKFIQEQKGLGDSVDFLFQRVRLFGSSAFSLSVPFSTLREGNLLSRSSEHYARAGCQVCIDHIGRSFSRSAQRPQNSLQGKVMAAGGSLSAQAKLGSHCVESTSLKSVQLSSVGIHPAVSYNNRSIKYGKVTMNLRNQEPRSNLVYGYFLFDVIGRSWKPSLFSLLTAKGFQTSCLAPHSAGAAPDMSFDGSTGAEQLVTAAVSPDQKLPGERSLKLHSGSCYLPHPDKEETGGEDAHFICVDEQAIGVADGVGGWADVGINAGHYARELMSHSVNAIQEEPKGSIDPARVLQKAYSSTKAKGSSTACIIALTEEGVHAVNLGDSGFVVVREGCTIFRSTVQQHDFNFPYQLASCNESDPPSSGQVFSIPVAAGDVIIAGTDGLFDNLYNNEVTAVVVHAVRAGLGPHVTAQKIAALARQRAQDRNRQTPFSTAAQDAGYRYYGGKLDDITVIVSYITTSI